MQHWTIVDASGAVIDQVITGGAHPRFHGFPWVSGEMVAHRTERQGDSSVERFEGRRWVPDPELVERRDRAARARRLPKTELVERIEALETALRRAETRLAALEGVIPNGLARNGGL